MKKKNKLLLWILVGIIIIALLVWCVVTKHSSTPQPQTSPNTPEEETPAPSIYLMEEKTKTYYARTLESASEDYVTLWVETNVFEGEKTLQIAYDNHKYTLATATPLLEGVAITKGEDENTFSIPVTAVENISMIFVKKSNAVVAEPQDIRIQVL